MMELAATRFMYWMTFLGIDVMLLFVVLRTHAHPFNLTKSTPTELMVLGFSGAGISITLQQWFWWVNENLVVMGRCKTHDPLVYNADTCALHAEWYLHAPKTVALYFSAIAFAPMIVNIPLRMIFGRVWYLAGLSLAPMAWGLGYAIAWLGARG